VISAIVLAAGTSSRLGRPKQLLRMAGKTVLQHVVDAAASSPVDEIVVVLGHAAEEVRPALAEHPTCRIVKNPDYLEGQSTSFRAGIHAADARAEGAVLLLGDQPGIRPDAIAAVVGAFREWAGPVVQATYGGRPAHPTLIAREVWDEMDQVSGDQGAREILARHAEWVRPVEVGGSPPDDIDTEEDYLRVKEAFELGEQA
jgi:molybdenum cofactor cytidylyltransferase